MVLTNYIEDVLKTYEASLLQKEINESFTIKDGQIIDQFEMPLTEEHHYGIAQVALKIITEEKLHKNQRVPYLSIAEHHAIQIQSPAYRAEIQRGIDEINQEIDFFEFEYGVDLSDLTRETSGGF